MTPNLIDDYLDKQQDMTAVEKFAFQHDMRQLPEGQGLYTDLIPKTTPGPGQQYAFEVNLDQCSGCKACVTACHNENGLDEDETWRSVGLLQGGTTHEPVIQHVTAACHHCLDAACLNGCPVNAYEKSPTTGVVKHLEDQCIGCRYCTLTCGYNVPKYSKKKGIVHKCDMCISRLEVGQAPACVRACPNGAIRITLVDTAAVRKSPAEYVNVPDAPDPHHTLPTTRYLHAKEFPVNMVSADFYSLKTEHSHLPLVIMLVLTQLSVGAFLVLALLAKYVPADIQRILTPYHVLVALGTGLLAIGASILHLGRPQYAFRSLIGLKKSWLSREILAFGLFTLTTVLYIFSYLPSVWIVSSAAQNILAGWTIFCGLAGVYCSVMVYRYTKRPFWDTSLTTAKFFMTTAILGITIILWATSIFSYYHSQSMFLIMQAFGKMLCTGVVMITAAKLIVESGSFVALRERTMTSGKKTAILMTGVLKEFTWGRFISGILGGIVGPAVWLIFHPRMDLGSMILLSTLIFVLSLTGEFLERYLFFKAVVPLQMPGSLGAKHNE